MFTVIVVVAYVFYYYYCWSWCFSLVVVHIYIYNLQMGYMYIIILYCRQTICIYWWRESYSYLRSIALLKKLCCVGKEGIVELYFPFFFFSFLLFLLFSFYFLFTHIPTFLGFWGVTLGKSKSTKNMKRNKRKVFRIAIFNF